MCNAIFPQFSVMTREPGIILISHEAWRAPESPAESTAAQLNSQFLDPHPSASYGAGYEALRYWGTCCGSCSVEKAMIDTCSLANVQFDNDSEH
jgi:hypothetical protein